MRKVTPIAVLAVVVGAVAFWAFRPDTLIFDDAVDESLEEAFVTTTTLAVATAPPVSDPARPPTTEDAPAAPGPAGPVAVATGTFTGIDHRARGTVTVYEQDGAYVLRFEDDTDIQNGPDLYVWLLPTTTYEGGTPTDFVDLGRLKGNVGGQNYQLPEDFDPGRPFTVLVWCLRFAVPFAAAPLT